jgi:hypothetical protein
MCYDTGILMVANKTTVIPDWHYQLQDYVVEVTGICQ